jgi:long-chain acyl-CoA synthetase
MRLEQFLCQSADRLGQKVAIVVGNARHFYAELDSKSGRLAAALVEHGIKPGDRVVVFMDNSFEAVVTIFAVLKAGAVVAPVDPASDADALAFVFDDSRASAIVTQARLASAAAAAMRNVATVRLVVLAGGDGAAGGESCLSFEEVVNRTGPSPVLPPVGNDDDTALVAYASAPPGLVPPASVSHREIAEAIGDVLPPREGGDDALVLRATAITTAHSLCRLSAAIKAGATLMLERRVARDRDDGPVVRSFLAAPAARRRRRAKPHHDEDPEGKRPWRV